MSDHSPSPIEQMAAEAMSIFGASEDEDTNNEQDEGIVTKITERIDEAIATASSFAQSEGDKSGEVNGDTQSPVNQQAMADLLRLGSLSFDASMDVAEDIVEEAEETANQIQEKAAEAIAVLGFEALYQDDIEDGTMAGGYMSDSSDGNSAASTTFTGFLFGESPEEGATIADYTLDDRSRQIGSKAEQSGAATSETSKGSVAWFHQRRIDKEKKLAPKVDIIMVTDDTVAKRVTPIRRTRSFSTADTTMSSTSAYDPKLTRPSKRRAMGKKMKGWLQSHRSVSNSKDQSEPRFEEPRPPPNKLQRFNPPDEPPVEEIEVEPMVGKQRRLTIILRKKRTKKVDNKMHGSCALGLLIEEFLDMGYFCRCLGEGMKEEGLRCTGYGCAEDDSVVADESEPFNSLPQVEKRNVETISI